MQCRDASPLSLKFSRPTYMDISHHILSSFCYLHEACALILIVLERRTCLLRGSFRAAPSSWSHYLDIFPFFSHQFFIHKSRQWPESDALGNESFTSECEAWCCNMQQAYLYGYFTSHSQFYCYLHQACVLILIVLDWRTCFLRTISNFLHSLIKAVA